MKKNSRIQWKRAISMCLAFQMAVSTPVFGQTVQTRNQDTKIRTDQYAAVLDLTAGGGSLLLSKNSDPSAWNTLEEDLIPGTTMFWDGSNTFQEAQITSEMTLGAFSQTSGVTGVKLGNEIEGVKTWFLFGDEILCAGAGITSAMGDGNQLVTIVDNIPVTSDTKLSLTNPSNGYRNVRTASKSGGVWESLINTAVKGVHTQRNWLSASSISGSSNQLEWSYVFGNGESGSYLSKEEVYYRLNTKGGDIAELAEFFIAPAETYQYTLVAGKTTADYSNSSLYQTNSKLLMNTTAIQAAANSYEGVVSIAKWEPGEIRVDNQVVPITLNQPAAIELKKDPSTGDIELTVANANNQSGALELVLETAGSKILSITNPDVLEEVKLGDSIVLKFDASVMGDEAVTINIEGKEPETLVGEELVLVRGEEGKIKKPDTLSGAVDWEVKIPKPDGSFVRTAGSNKIKRELLEGETDGNRTAGDADGSHIASVRGMSNGDGILTGQEKGTAAVVATDEHGTQVIWTVHILYEDPSRLPVAEASDFADIRNRWKEYLIGDDLTILDGGAEILADIDAAAEAAWEAYAYQGQESCPGIPWPLDEGAAGNADVPYQDDAVEFRPAFKKVLAMSEAYAAVGSKFYQDAQLLNDIKQILNYLCTTCYTPKTQTDNWWTWEIGLPKDLLPTLVLLYDDLTEDEIALYTEALYFFQLDPYHEGAIGTGSTHAQGYRTAQGANIIDCSRTALGLGILREDNELVYLAQKASSETFVIQSVKDSTKIASEGYVSGFYSDGSYLDHSHVPYLGSYGVEFLKGGAGLPPLFAKTPWEYPREVQENLEFYLKEGFLNGMYNGLMLDNLKGRSVSRPGLSNREAGRDAMNLMIQLQNSVSPEVEMELKNALKAWIELDPGFIDSLTGVEDMAVKAKALEIMAADDISGYIAPIHKNLPLMDRAIHRTDEYLVALSMYSERIQNTEIMNHENRYGWHQGSGMTYIYNSDIMQYTENFWNTVNPLRLAGTTLVSKNIGNGEPDSSGFAQGGDFRSKEAWVGGSSIGTDGVNGMSLTGEVLVKNGEGSPAVPYSPQFSAKKSWFMFGDQIVCLGAGITNSGEDYLVESIIENRRLNSEADNNFIVNGENRELPLQTANLEDIVDNNIDVSGIKIPEASWAHLEGNVEGSSIGYYFPKGSQTISVRKGRNDGDWSLVGSSEGSAQENYLEMWFDHGANPTNETYEYVILPGYNAEETEDYSIEPGIKILANTPELQAVSKEDGNMLGANIWTDETVEVEDLVISRAASVMTKEDEDNILTIAVSDPTMKNSGSITVEIKRSVEEVLEHDDNIEVQLTDNGARLIINTKGTNGASSYATLKVASSITPPAVEKVKELIKQAVQAAEDSGDYESEAVLKAVQAVFIALDATSTDELAQYCMDELLIFEELYVNVLAANGDIIGSRVELSENAEIEVSIEGIALNIPLKSKSIEKGTPSDADFATPSSAKRFSEEKEQRSTVRTAVMKVIESNSSDQDDETKKIKTSLEFKLYLEEDGARTGPFSLKSPVKIWFKMKDNLYKPETMTATLTTADGISKLLSITDLGDEGMFFILPESGTVLLTADDISPEEEIFQVSINDKLKGGVITANPMSGKKGTMVTVETIPDEGFLLSSLLINGKVVSSDTQGRYSFALQKDTYITGVFKRIARDNNGSSNSSDNRLRPGWQKSNGKWYYLSENGVKLTGWLLEDEKWYWLDLDGAMKIGWYLDEADGHWYYLKEDGAMITGWNCIDEKWYYFAEKSEGDSGWQLIGSQWVYKKEDTVLRSYGSLYSNSITPDGYKVDENGVWIMLK